MSSASPSSPDPSSLPPVIRPPEGTRPQPSQPQSLQPPAPQSPQPDRHAVMHNRPLILGLLFGVTAILGLPLLWFSPVFSLKEKFWWSVAITFYTLVLVLIAAAALMLAYNAWTQGLYSAAGY